MAEIRVRDASPQLMKQLQEISLEMREATITGTLTRLIPRFHDQKARIKEQEEEIRKLSFELRQHQMNKSSMHEQFNLLAGFLRMHGKDITQAHQQVTKMQERFGTKRSRPAGAGSSRKCKKVPSPKNKK